LSINGLFANTYIKSAIDSSINSILRNYYTNSTTDASISGNIYNKTAIDLSINNILRNYYTNSTTDASISGNIYNKRAIDLSINGLFANTYIKSDIDSSINNILRNYYTNSTTDASISGNIYSKTAIDLSINGLFANTYIKSAIDSSINSILRNYYTNSTTDASISGNIYSKTAIDLSINGLFANTYIKSAIDSSINNILRNYYTNSTTDASISGNIYSKTAIDASINGVIGNTVSRLTDVSLNGNIQMGTTRFISVGINKTPSTLYALDISGDLDVNGNAYIGTGTHLVGINKTDPAYEMDVSGTLNARNILINGATITASVPGYSGNTFSFDTSFNSNVQIGNTTATRSLGINRTADPLYSLDISGDVRITETGLGTAASATTGTLVLSHTATGGRSSITFTSPNSGSDYGYIQYFDNSNSILTTETSGGLMVIGVESRDGSGNTSDRISLFASNGTGNVGVNTTTPEYHLDVSGTLRYSAVSENLVPIAASSSVIGIVYGIGDGTINGMVRYITSVTVDLSLNISNLPLIINRSYVFTVIYNGVSTTTNYIKRVTLAFAGVGTGTSITPKGTVTALTATTFFIQQFYVFIVDTTNIGNCIVFQTLTS